MFKLSGQEHKAVDVSKSMKSSLQYEPRIYNLYKIKICIPIYLLKLLKFLFVKKENKHNAHAQKQKKQTHGILQNVKKYG